MTPLAWQLFEDAYALGGIHVSRSPHLLRGDTQKNREDTVRLLRTFLYECKFFEVTKVWPIASHLARDMWEQYEDHDRVDQRRAYLPATWTWLEVDLPSMKGIVDDEARRRGDLINSPVMLDQEDLKKSTHNYRAAWVLVGRGPRGLHGNGIGDSTFIADRYQVQYETPHREGTPRVWRVDLLDYPLPLVQSGLKPERFMEHRDSEGRTKRFDKAMSHQVDFVHYAMLALINSPKIIGQRGHYPHGRVERDLLKKAKLVGKFPLRAWTEIVLEVTAHPKYAAGDPSVEMHLTGERCLHYCRTYLRVRGGMLEYVEGHWRGNPALGMKRSRYRVEPEKQGK